MRNLQDLRVPELKDELEKRGLEKTGVKAVLIERLRKAMKENDQDPDTFDFDEEEEETCEDAEVIGESIESTEEVGERIDDLLCTNTSNDKADKTESDGEYQVIEEKKDKDSDFDADDLVEKEIQHYADSDEETEKEKLDDSVSKNAESKDDGDVKIKEEEEETEVKEDKEEELTDELNKDNTETQDNDETTNEQEHTPEVKKESNEESKGKSTTSKKYSEFFEGLDMMCEDEDELIYDYADELQDDADSSGKRKAGSGKGHSEKSSKGTTKEDSSNSEDKEEKNKSEESSENKEEKTDMDSDNDTNLWVSGLDKSTKAQDLKSLFSDFGKVVTVKIVMNSKTPDKCFGFVTLATKEGALKCIEELNQKEFKGNTITVEKSPVKIKSNAEKKKDVFKKSSSSKTRSKSRERRRRRSRSRSRHSRSQRSRSKDIQSRKLFVGALDPATETGDLVDHFTKFGKLFDAVVIRDPRTRETRRFGFVTFELQSAFQSALDARPHIIRGTKTDTKEATPREATDDRRRGGDVKERLDNRRGIENRIGRRTSRDRDSRRGGRRDERRRSRSRRRSRDRDTIERDSMAREREELRREREELERQKRQIFGIRGNGRESKRELLRLERERIDQEREQLMRNQMSYNNNSQQPWGNSSNFNMGGGMKRGNDAPLGNDFKRPAFDLGAAANNWGTIWNQAQNLLNSNFGMNLNSQNMMGNNPSGNSGPYGMMQQNTNWLPNNNNSSNNNNSNYRRMGGNHRN